MTSTRTSMPRGQRLLRRERVAGTSTRGACVGSDPRRRGRGGFRECPRPLRGQPPPAHFFGECPEFCVDAILVLEGHGSPRSGRCSRPYPGSLAEQIACHSSRPYLWLLFPVNEGLDDHFHPVELPLYLGKPQKLDVTRRGGSRRTSPRPRASVASATLSLPTSAVISNSGHDGMEGTAAAQPQRSLQPFTSYAITSSPATRGGR